MANFVLILHALFVTVVVLSVPLIIAGGVFRWKWVRNPWFRFTHLAMIGFVAFESLIGMNCPLTIWESDLRENAGENGYGDQEFIANWLHKIMFFELPHWVFTTTYIGFGLLVAVLFVVVPVRLKAKTL